MRISISAIILFLMLANAAFSKTKWQQTASGMQYKVAVTDNSKPMPMYGDFIRMHLVKYDHKGKEIFNTRIFDKADGVEMELKHKPNEKEVTEIFTVMHEGDSAFVKVVEKKGRSRHTFYYRLYLYDVERREVYFRQKDIQKQQQFYVDSISIQQYLRQNGLTDAQPDGNGNYFIRSIIAPQKQIQAGDTVVMHYIGKFLDNTAFDNSIDRKQPFTFKVGAKQVIDGLDKSIRQFNFGDKGIIFIPSKNAYGDNDNNGIPANSVLIFEVEIAAK
ncbi:MAG TPA: FKBP-type peptidyl-prolyl cis-trans isomerase [Chitinophagales bacterium]|nr:FKBP-type peptidyl-prolyl cis-trans isomerase [Chitinophagales bacterium]HNL83939.1 FKBP-type peptidyl-prolyl cis-trans isomerase [Chitinophagales bacterium]